MIIDTVGFQLPPQMPFIYDDNVIQTLSPYGPDNSLNIRILPRRARGRKHFVDAETFHSIAKSTAIDAVSVTQQVAWSGIEGKGLHQLLCCPLGSWMFGHVKVNDFSPFVMQNDQHV
jgi:hypothetical protein